MRLSPLSREAQKLYRNSDALVFADYVLSQAKKDDFDTLQSMLGTRWTRAEVQEMFSPKTGSSRKQVDEISVPVAFWVNPHAQEYLQNVFGSSQAPEWAGSEIVEGFEMDRAEFMRIAGMFAPLTGAGAV